MNSELNLVADECGERLFAEATSQFTGADGRELFSFGNGTFYDGMEAKEILSSDSKHVACVLTKDSYVILEKKKMFAHLCDLPCLEQGYPLHEVVRMLEDAGEETSMSPTTFARGWRFHRKKPWSFAWKATTSAHARSRRQLKPRNVSFGSKWYKV